MKPFLNREDETQIHTSIFKDQTLSTTYFLPFCIIKWWLGNKNCSGFDEFITESIALKKQIPSNLRLNCLSFRDCLPKRHMKISTCGENCLTYKESEKEEFCYCKGKSSETLKTSFFQYISWGSFHGYESSPLILFAFELTIEAPL